MVLQYQSRGTAGISTRVLGYTYAHSRIRTLDYVPKCSSAHLRGLRPRVVAPAPTQVDRADAKHRALFFCGCPNTRVLECLRIRRCSANHQLRDCRSIRPYSTGGGTSWERPQSVVTAAGDRLRCPAPCRQTPQYVPAERVLVTGAVLERALARGELPGVRLVRVLKREVSARLGNGRRAALVERRHSLLHVRAPETGACASPLPYQQYHGNDE